MTLDVSNEELESTLESALGKISSMPLSKVHFSHEETSPTPKLSTNVEEIEEFNAIYNEVTGVFTFEMGQLGEQVNLNQTVNDLEEVVTEFSDLITSQLQSRPVFSELLLNRIQVLVDTELSSLLGRITMAHQEALIDLFTKRLSKISPTSFRSNARILLKQVVKRHEEFKSNAVKGNQFHFIQLIKQII